MSNHFKKDAKGKLYIDRLYIDALWWFNTKPPLCSYIRGIYCTQSISPIDGTACDYIRDENTGIEYWYKNGTCIRTRHIN